MSLKNVKHLHLIHNFFFEAICHCKSHNYDDVIIYKQLKQ